MKTSKTLNIILIMAGLGLGISVGIIGCASEDRTHETAGEGVNDDEITTHVMAALAASSDYKYSDVHASTYKSKVQLSGFVDTGAHKDQAETVAKQVEGVKGVINNITVK